MSIDVIGGAYIEVCSYPRSTVHRGSGVRAACVLAGMGDSVSLHTILGEQLSGDFAKIADIKGIGLHSVRRKYEISFYYRHPLDQPEIDIGDGEFPTLEGLSALENALVFGMIEGRPVVHAQAVVYDPQDGEDAMPFDANGSSAGRLAIVASLSEARVLSGEQAPEDAARALLRGAAEVVIVKCGMLGAVLATPDHEPTWIRAFPTDYVWKIGSGDVFSAAFAHAWLREQASPLEAAWFASRWVAEYVRTRREQLSAEELITLRQEATAAAKFRNRPVVNQKPVYLAGPFFNTAQTWLIDEIRSLMIDAGVQVFSPIHDIGEGPAHEVAPADLHAIDQSGLVLALLDGLDAGTLFEVGYARARGIPVVGIAECVDEPQLTMLVGSRCIIRDDLCSGIYEACWQLISDD
ncbi:PfkB family carbohydrate kinase [Lysobacter capsici]|uniref:PfkB family carbohydrate kinase n=1 Tax=Lysobacter capsici TaxID=435897 RepID=UPI000A93D600|nr:PfkB family carbohydrate kinase [Lysobacter capsici]